MPPKRNQPRGGLLADQGTMPLTDLAVNKENIAAGHFMTISPPAKGAQAGPVDLTCVCS
jgi:hypothetical protein